jgi:hypothetical protein
MLATPHEIQQVLWARLRDGTAQSTNWGTAMDNSIWHVGTHTYINGIMLHVDFDYEGMWLLEVCHRDPDNRVNDPTLTTWLAVATTTEKDHWAWYPAPPQPFFGRTTTAWDVIAWACEWYKNIDMSRTNDISS